MSAPKGNKNALGNPGGGRKSQYQDKFAAMARKACEAGFTDVELGDLLGVTERTINVWKLEHLEFASALKLGKAVVDDRVEKSLFARATGYEHDEIDIRVIEGEIVQTQIRKRYPPDPTSMIFWLKNRRKDEWRDKVETGVTDKDGNDVPIDPMEAARRIAFVLMRGVDADERTH